MMFDKTLLFVFAYLQLQVYGFEKLNEQYLISYGEKTAKTKIVEYFSFSCPRCIDFIVDDFPQIKKGYLKQGSVFWIFHPDPADRLTLQGLICLKLLPDIEKRIFLETVAKIIQKDGLERGVEIMKITAETLGFPVLNLEKGNFLKESDAFQDAFKYLSQKDVISSVPTIEINQKVYDEYPSYDFVINRIQEDPKL